MASRTADAAEGATPTVGALANQAREALQALARRPDVAAFEALLDLSRTAGECVGDSARLLAEHGSWAQVAGVAGTSRQAAWARWSS